MVSIITEVIMEKIYAMQESWFILYKSIKINKNMQSNTDLYTVLDKAGG